MNKYYIWKVTFSLQCQAYHNRSFQRAFAVRHNAVCVVAGDSVASLLVVLDQRHKDDRWKNEDDQSDCVCQSVKVTAAKRLQPVHCFPRDLYDNLCAYCGEEIPDGVRCNCTRDE